MLTFIKYFRKRPLKEERILNKVKALFHRLGVRLVGSEYPDRGTIEVLHNGRWGTICDDRFEKVDADVICRILGYYSAR